jgi:hypothetical protein
MQQHQIWAPMNSLRQVVPVPLVEQFLPQAQLTVVLALRPSQLQGIQQGQEVPINGSPHPTEMFGQIFLDKPILLHLLQDR